MHLTACKLMSSPVLSFSMQPSVSLVYEAIISNDFNGYPIVNEDKRLMGLISKHFLTVLLNKQCWKDKTSITPRATTGRSKLSAKSSVSLVENNNNKQDKDQDI